MVLDDGCRRRALVAAALGLIEQVTEFAPPRKLTLKNGAWRFWVLRVLVEAGSAAIVSGIAQGVELQHAGAWWGGALAGMGTAAGLRSSFLELGDLQVGVRTGFDPFRKWLTARLRVSIAVHTSAVYLDEHVPVIRSSDMGPQDVAERVNAFIGDYSGFSNTQRRQELEAVKTIVDDEATDARDRVDALLERARTLGGEDLIASIAEAAEERRSPNA